MLGVCKMRRDVMQLAGEPSPCLQNLDRFAEQPLLVGRRPGRAAAALALRTPAQPCLDRDPVDRAVLAQAFAAIDRDHETNMPAMTVMLGPHTVQPLEQVHRQGNRI